MSTTYEGNIMMNDPFVGLTGFGTSPPQTQQSNPFAVQQQYSQEQASVSSGNPYGNYQQQPQQQAPAPSPVANDNPFAAYNNQAQPQQQQSMVPSGQQNNQWSMQTQQQPSSYNMQMGYQMQSPQSLQQGGYPQQNLMTPQQHQPNQLERVTSSAQSVASSQFMTPNTFASPQSQNTAMMTPGIPTQAQQQQFFSPLPGPAPAPSQTQQAYPNTIGFMNQESSLPPVPPAVPPPAPPVIATTTDEDDDFFGAFSTSVQQKEAQSPPKSTRPPSEFETDNYDGVSVLSKSTNNTERNSQGASPLDDPRFAPKPPKPHGLENALALARNAPPGSSPLPNYELVTHSGYALARISFRTILIKKWKQVFWVTYGTSKLLVFRSSADFEDWVSNPYLNSAQREFLVKLEIDFVGDLGDKSVRGYQVTNQRLKNYSNQML